MSDSMSFEMHIKALGVIHEAPAGLSEKEKITWALQKVGAFNPPVSEQELKKLDALTAKLTKEFGGQQSRESPMSNLTEALQRLAEADERYYYDTITDNLYLMEGKIPVRGYSAKNLTQDSCDEIAAAIGYVLERKAVPQLDEYPRIVHRTGYVWYDESGARRVQEYATQWQDCGEIKEQPELARLAKQNALAAAINHYLESNVHNG